MIKIFISIVNNFLKFRTKFDFSGQLLLVFWPKKVISA